MEMTEIKMASMIAASDPKVMTSTLGASQAESREGRFFDDEEDF